MYCIDTGAIAFMFNGGSSCALTIHPIDTEIGMEYLCYRASDAVLPIFVILGVRGHLWRKRGPPSLKSEVPGRRKSPYCIKNGRTASLALITEVYCTNFGVHRMNSKAARAASVLSTRSCFTSFVNWYKVFNGLDGVKGPLLACMNHMNHEMYIHPCFLAPWVYICSTSLTRLQRGVYTFSSANAPHSSSLILNKKRFTEDSDPKE